MSHLVTTDTTSFIAITLIELPSAVVLILLMDIWGRKPLMVKLNCFQLLGICNALNFRLPP